MGKNGSKPRATQTLHRVLGKSGGVVPFVRDCLHVTPAKDESTLQLVL